MDLQLQHHVLDAICDKAAPNPFIISTLNLMEFSIAFAKRLYSDIKEPNWFKNSSNPHIHHAHLWIKQEVGLWVVDEDLLTLAELIQNDWKWKLSFRAHLKFETEQDPGYALLQIKRGMELKTSVAEEAGEQPLPEVEEKKPKKQSNGHWGHKMAHYGDQVKEGYCDGFGNSDNLQQRLYEWKPKGNRKGVLRLIRSPMEFGFSARPCMPARIQSPQGERGKWV